MLLYSRASEEPMNAQETRNYSEITPEILKYTDKAMAECQIEPSLYIEHKVNRGLRDLNGRGVLTGLTEISEIIFNLINKNKKGCVVVVNKWDTIEKGNNTMKEYTEVIKQRLSPFNDLPIIFTSVINKQRILDVLDATAKVYENFSQKIPTSRLNEAMLPEIENYPPPATKGKYIKIKFITQLPTQSPSFAFFCNLPQYIKDPYKRFLENKLRSYFDFTGCPIQIYMRQK